MNQIKEPDLGDVATDGQIETASRELAKSLWDVILLGRDEYKARSMMGRVKRKELVDRILELARLLRGRRQ
jgi:3'-phosphoadenosine 5'-phosphosulfate sulfotransferase